jgi:hypothetical protein
LPEEMELRKLLVIMSSRMKLRGLKAATFWRERYRSASRLI